MKCGVLTLGSRPLRDQVQQCVIKSLLVNLEAFMKVRIQIIISVVKPN